MPGYAATPADGFSKPGLTCLHCDQLLREPVQTEEGFRLCKQCFKEIQSYPGATCGKCQITASENCYPDKAVQREVLALQVFCKHSRLGCPWTGTLKQWEAHVGGCSFQGSPCPHQGCVEIVSRQFMETHLKECPFRPTLCAHCSTTVAYNLLETHYSVCEEIEVRCEEPLCGLTFLRKNMSDHKTRHCKIETCLTCKTKVFRDSGVEMPEIDQIAAAASCRGGPQAPPTLLRGGPQPPSTNLRADPALLKSPLPHGSYSSPQPIFSASGVEDYTYLTHLSDPLANFRHHQALALSVKELKDGVTGARDGQKAVLEEFIESKKIISQLQSENIELKSELTGLKQAISKIQDQMIEAAAPPVSRIRGNKPSSDYTSIHGNYSDQRGAESESPVVLQLRRDLIGLTQTVEDIKSRAERGLARTSHRDDIERDSARGTRGSGLTSTSDARLLLAVEKRVEEVARQLTQVKLHGQELELQLQASLASTHNGSFLWRIPEVSRRRRDAIDERVTSIYSPPFYTGRNGYKMCIRAYLNGDGMGYKTHLSLFFVLMRGECDPLLKWPFEYKVSMILVDQTHRKHIVQTFKPTPDSSSFQQPQTDMNVASGCPQFAKLSVFDEDCYVKNDVMFVKCIVDITKIFHP